LTPIFLKVVYLADLHLVVYILYSYQRSLQWMLCNRIQWWSKICAQWLYTIVNAKTFSDTEMTPNRVKTPSFHVSLVMWYMRMKGQTERHKQ